MNNVLPDNIKKLRMEKNLTQKQLAEQLGMNGATISAYENGTRAPSISNLCKLVAFFSTSVDYIIGYAPPKSRIANSMLEEALLISIREVISDYLNRYKHYF